MGYGMATQDQFEADKLEAAEAVIAVLRKVEGAALQQSDIAFSEQDVHMLIIPINMEVNVAVSMHDVALTDDLRKFVVTKITEQLINLWSTLDEEIQAFEASIE